MERWTLSEYVSEAQVAEWRANDAENAVNTAPADARRRFLDDKAATKGYRDWPLYAKRLGVPLRGRVIEIGAGTLWLSSLLSGRPEIESVIGVELAERRVAAFADIALDLFDGDATKMRHVVGDMHRLEVDDASMDLVVCDATLHHADNLVAVLREARRVLRPGGQFIATREHLIPRYRRTPVFDEATPEDGSAMYYYRGGWKSAFVNGRYEAFRMCRFYEDMTVKGVRLPRRLQPWLRPVMLPLWLAKYPKVAMAARRP